MVNFVALEAETAPVIVVGAHHKTGSKWMATTFRALARRLNRSYFNGYEDKVPADIDIYVQANSLFSAFYLNRLRDAPRGWRGIHLIRDPRDVIISGCFYHLKSQERWLHEPAPNLGGRTYQQAINALESVEARLEFEMEHKGRITIEQMLAWDYAQSEFLELRYEDLIADTSFQHFMRIFAHLGLNAAQSETALRVVHNHSLFGAKAEKRGADVHLRSGEARQWPQYFTPRLIERFKTLFPGALVKLGYEQNDNWTAEPGIGVRS